LTTVPAPETPDTPGAPPRRPTDHPVRMRVTGDLSRSRLTVFFRLALFIPHFVWLGIWGIAIVLLAIVNWLVVLVRGQTPAGLHRMFARYVNYSTHVYAYISLAANRFPGFVGESGYDVDLDIAPPARQNRWKVAFRLILAIPALVVSWVVGTGGSVQVAWYGSQMGWVMGSTAFLIWFYALVKGRAPEGVSRLQWYGLHYSAQASSYVLLLTDRYPNSDPALTGAPRTAPPHPIRLRSSGDDGRRSRLTTFFRLLLAVPHLIWLELWALLALLAAIANWLVTLIRGRSPSGLHNFLGAFTRYQVHVIAYIALLANPFPGFAGAPGSYPVDIEIAPPETQNRWVTGFRGLLILPALILNSAISAGLYVAAFLGWFAVLFTGRMPRGLRNLGAFAVRYTAQTNSYGWALLTDRYPYAGPAADADSVADASPLGWEPPAAPPGMPPTSAGPTDPRGVWRDSPFVDKPEEREPPA
jgi:hypothetical protein